MELKVGQARRRRRPGSIRWACPLDLSGPDDEHSTAGSSRVAGRSRKTSHQVTATAAASMPLRKKI